MQTTAISMTVEFPVGNPPDYDLLKERGWVHPPGIYEGKVLESSLVKNFGDVVAQIVHKKFGPRDHYTCGFSSEIVPYRRVGDGPVSELELLLDVIKEFGQEIDECQDGDDF